MGRWRLMKEKERKDNVLLICFSLCSKVIKKRRKIIKRFQLIIMIIFIYFLILSSLNLGYLRKIFSRDKSDTVILTHSITLDIFFL